MYNQPFAFDLMFYSSTLLDIREKKTSYISSYSHITTKIPCFAVNLQEGFEIELHGRGGEVEAELLQDLGVEDTERSNDLGLSLLAEVNICAS